MADCAGVADSAAIIEFWFGTGHGDDAALARNVERWFRGGEALDTAIRQRFAATVDAAARGELDAWAESPRDRLALIVLLDQFPRHLYRGTARAFALDPLALSLSLGGLDAGMDAGLAPLERAFFCMPLEHAESLPAQRRAVAELEAIAAGVPPGPLARVLVGFVGSAREHHAIIERFGRFPHRNRVLGRATTREEAEFLDGGGSTFGQ